MNITDTIVPRSDQINADDLITSPITVTVDRVTEGAAEQPIDVHLVEFPDRAYRPSKSMRRVLVAAWGPETDVWTGRRMTLYREPTIRFGKDEVGGIRLSHLSHIDRPLKIALTVTRGKRDPFTVQPLTDATPKRATSNLDAARARIAVAETDEQLRAVWDSLDPKDREQLAGEVKARKAELEATDGA